VKPTMVAEVEYRAWTHDGKLRQSSYKGLREPEENAVFTDLRILIAVVPYSVIFKI
jgi:bifunctional non-homologous end joining protein LigD